jgi:hypothetical protein
MASQFEGPLTESRTPSRSTPQPIITPLGQARSLLEDDHWTLFSAPQSLPERLFWQSLSERQKLVGKLIWPLGLHWKRARPVLFRAAGVFLATAGALRLLSFTPFVSLAGAMGFSFTAVGWFVIAMGSLLLFAFAPILPGCEYVFQPLALSGRIVPRCQIFPVSISEISAVMHRCQSIRSASACWIGAAYGALAWSIMGLSVGIGASAGLSIILLSLAFHPFTLIAKLANLTHIGGRRWASFPNVLIFFITVIFALLGFLFVMMVPTMLATDPPVSFYAMLPAVFAIAVVLRFVGWAQLRIYLIFIERSWLDAVVEAKPARRR